MKNGKDLKIVCLGGGVGTVQLLRGLRNFSQNITVICSMADEGGSGGRLRRLYSVPPPGDLINCVAALSDAEPILKKLLTYRFPGNRWGGDTSLEGQKLGNLILVALTKILGNFDQALGTFQKIFRSHGQILPATQENVSIWAQTQDGQRIEGEEKIDLGQYNGQRSLSQVFLTPQKVTASLLVKKAIRETDVIIVGPGDLYTTVLPVLIVPGIQKEVKTSKATRIYVVNVANKPFETPNYKLSDYLGALKKHCPGLNFNYILANNNFRPKIPTQLKYQYVKIDPVPLGRQKIIKEDLVEQNYPLYHNPTKLAKRIMEVVRFEK